MLKRFPLIHDAKRGWLVDMPTYSMVAGSFLPVVAGHIDAHGVLRGPTPAAVLAHSPSVEVQLPEDTPLDLFGNVDAAAMRHRYRGHPRFGSDTWHPPKEVKV